MMDYGEFADEERAIEKRAQEMRDTAAAQYGVELYEGDLPEPATVTPSEYMRMCQTRAMARRMVKIEAKEREELDRLADQERKAGEEPKEGEEFNRLAAITDPDELWRIAKEEEAGFEAEERKRREALYPDISGVTHPDELYRIYKAQQAAERELEARKGGKK